MYGCFFYSSLIMISAVVEQMSIRQPLLILFMKDSVHQQSNKECQKNRTECTGQSQLKTEHFRCQDYGKDIDSRSGIEETDGGT